jgi:hypothetical protein
MADSHGDGISDRFFLANTIVGPQMDFSSFGSTSAIRGVRSEDWKQWDGKGPARGKSTPGRSRTCDLCLRRAALYPAELLVLEIDHFQKEAAPGAPRAGRQNLQLRPRTCNPRGGQSRHQNSSGPDFFALWASRSAFGRSSAPPTGLEDLPLSAARAVLDPFPSS